MKKRIISILMVCAILLSTLAFSLTAFASSQRLYLDVKATAVMNGVDDLEWFYYTPDKSGLYTFASYNVAASKAHLFIKEYDEQTNMEKYVWLAGADDTSNPNYPSSRQFSLTYHLEAGVKYYYAAGWVSENRTDGTMTVMLTCDSYDENAIESIEASCPVVYDVYLDGGWQNDANDQRYFKYNISKIIKNTTVTVHYSNGKSSTVTGQETVDGYNIKYIDNQDKKHWYPASDPNYTGNEITVQILDKTTKMNITVSSTARYLVKGKVLNLANQPVKNAALSVNSTELAFTDENGLFSFYISGGNHSLKISAPNSIDRVTPILVAAQIDGNDWIDNPFYLCNCDYVRDGIVNAKDFAYIIKNVPADMQEQVKAEFRASINFTEDDYE